MTNALMSNALGIGDFLDQLEIRSIRSIVCFLTAPVLFLLSFSFVGAVFAASYPAAVGHVNDFAKTFSPGFVSEIEQQLTQYEASTGNEIAVVTVPSLENSDIETYAVELFEKWKIGKKGKDNGVLLLIAPNDRQVRIEVGYGLEDRITDGRAGDIIRNAITPAFKEGKYEDGVRAAVTRLMDFASGDRAPPEEKKPAAAPDIPIVPILVGGYVLFTYLGSFLGRTKTIWPGAVIGGALGGIGGFALAAFAGLLGIGIAGALFGLLLDYILSKNYKVRATHHLPTGFWGSGGGFKSGGGGWGGGGFGGFGGGSSGGGGASGRW